MLESIPVEFITMSGAAVGGWAMKMKALDNERRHKEHVNALESFVKASTYNSKSADAAGERVSSSAGKIARRIIAYVLVLAVVTLPFVAALLDIPTVVQTTKESGGFLWGLFGSGTKQQFVSLIGYFYSPAVLTGFGHVIAFYFGQGAAKP